MEKTVWLLVIDDHRDATQYRVCDSRDAAQKLFEKVVRENYFYTETSSEERLRDQVRSDCGRWETDEGDYVTFYELPVLTIANI